jgi:hypothetical protein
MLLGMNWERRLREMVLAGGALSATACGGSTEAPVDAASHESSNGDATTPGDDATISGSGGCCNADPDPCCPMLKCLGPSGPGPGVGPDDPTYLLCEARYQCEDFMNGIYTQEPDGSLVCVPRGIVVDASAGLTDVDATDASNATSLQCGGGTFSGAGTDQCINSGGVCIQFPDPSCCDFVPGFDPTNSGCPHAAFAIRCCALDGGAGKDAGDASAE